MPPQRKPVRDGRWPDNHVRIAHLYFVGKQTKEQIKGQVDDSNEIIEKVMARVDSGFFPPNVDWAPNPPREVNVAQPKEDVQKAVKQGGTQQSRKTAVKITDDFDEAAIIDFTPSTFRTTSTVIWLARAVCAKHWGPDWQGLTPGQFIDKFILMALRSYGIQLHSYTILPGAQVYQGAGEAESGNGSSQDEEEMIFSGEGEEGDEDE